MEQVVGAVLRMRWRALHSLAAPTRAPDVPVHLKKHKSDTTGLWVCAGIMTRGQWFSLQLDANWVFRRCQTWIAK